MGTSFNIPDYELVIEIARGSYGQVWLARNVLGTWRAVKIVQRSLFEDVRPYQREFNGIRHYEALSRGHDGLIDLLHVGRNEDDSYFYYVMELADDQVVGQRIQTADYAPRTLQSEMSARGPLPAEECIDLGAQLADALDYLHQNNLVHRDIKPSNIVFVSGQPKLADIGLVAGSGMTSFSTGTLGFLPSEGTGGPDADVYALGKVLYEISTGKDRNAFPDLPASARGLSGREKLMQLNPLLLRACASDDGDRFENASDFANALRQLNAPSVFAGPFNWRERRLIALATALALLLVISDALLIYLGTREVSEPDTAAQSPAPEAPLQGKYDSDQ
ncbi:MAG: serine/threonine protein kinase [Verrucomicrobia subdivision 3 bacterium]|nr:serine/threonine protein kinase [Limisphaerales bacterium]